MEIAHTSAGPTVTWCGRFKLGFRLQRKPQLSSRSETVVHRRSPRRRESLSAVSAATSFQTMTVHTHSGFENLTSVTPVTLASREGRLEDSKHESAVASKPGQANSGVDGISPRLVQSHHGRALASSGEALPPSINSKQVCLAREFSVTNPLQTRQHAHLVSAKSTRASRVGLASQARHHAIAITGQSESTSVPVDREL